MKWTIAFLFLAFALEGRALSRPIIDLGTTRRSSLQVKSTPAPWPSPTAAATAEMIVDSKTRGDAEIDKIFKSEKDRDVFFVASEKRNLYETQTILKREHQLDLSLNTISRWLGKERKSRADDAFFKLIGEIKDDAERADTFAKEIGDAQKLTTANVTMLSQALFRARRTNDPKAMRSSAILLSMLIEAVAKQNASKASVISAETSRDRFQFDAAKKALEHASELQDIQKSSGSEREKVERAVDRLFGKRPSDRGQTSQVSSQTEGTA